MPETQYQNQAKSLQDSRNFNLSAKNTDFSFGVSRWAGMQTSLPQTSDATLYQSMMINTLPQLTHCEQSPGISATGFHRDTDIHIQKECLIGGESVTLEGNIFLWKIVWDKNDNKGDFYYTIQSTPFEDTIWSKGNPKKDITKKDSFEYRFIGRHISHSYSKGSLYFCSGEENFTDSFGDKSGVMCFDLSTLTWTAIPTGKAAPYDISKKAKNIQDILATYNDLSSIYKNLEDFNPSIIIEYNNRLLITGSKANPTQVKVSEYMNYKNFVDNVIGYNPNGLTIEDNRKASTFTISQSIKSATVFSNSVFLGTPRSMWVYTLIPSDKGIDLDQLYEDVADNVGTISNRSVKVYYGNMFFGSTSLTTPQLSTKELEYKTSLTGGRYTVPLPASKVSQFIDETMKRCDISNSCMGVYKDYVFWSVSLDKEQNDYEEAKNNITIVYKRAGDFIMFSIIDYIHANYFFEVNGGGLYYCSADDGNIYQVREDLNYIDRKTNYNYDPQQPYVLSPITYQSVIQTGIIGIDQKRDNGFSEKGLKYLYLELGIAASSILEIEIYGIGDQCKNCCSSPLWNNSIFIDYECLDPNSTDPTLSDPGIMNLNPLSVDLNYYRGVKYKPLRIVFDETIKYSQLYVRLKLNNSAGFFLKSIQGVYMQTQIFGEEFNVCKDDFKNLNIEKIIVNNSNDFAQEFSCKTCQF